MTKACCHTGEANLVDSKEDRTTDSSRLFVMVGNPNVGKTTLINAISGASLRIGNWPGTTVERMETHFIYHCNSKELQAGAQESENTALSSQTKSDSAEKTSTEQAKVNTEEAEDTSIRVHLVDLTGAYGLVASSAEE